MNIFLLALFCFDVLLLHIGWLVPAQEWHEKLQSLKQDSSADSPKSAELH
jgi:hypothetical protein